MKTDNSRVKQLTDKKEIEKLFDYYEEELYNDVEKREENIVAIITKEEELSKTLTEAQKKKFEELSDLNINRNYDINKKIFVWAYSLGVRTIIECIKN